MLTDVELEVNDGSVTCVQFPEVRADSRTPYTDATSWYFGQRSGQQQSHRTGERNRNGSVDRTSLLDHSDAAACERVKRPMNAFMVWSQIQRRLIAASTPGLHNAVISKQLGRQWNSLQPEEQQPFIAESIRLRRFHMVEYPSYKYKPRRKSVSADTAKSERTGTSIRKVLSASKLQRQAKLQRHQRRRASNSCSSSTSHESDASSVPADVQEEVEQELLFFSMFPSQEFSNLDWNSSSFDDAVQQREQTARGVQLRPSKFSQIVDSETLCDTSSFDCYSTPEVDALLADDWLAGANSYCSRTTFPDIGYDLIYDDDNTC